MMKRNCDITEKELEALIARYFDGQTSVEDERVLRECLADKSRKGEAVDEARFTLGLLSVGGGVQRHTRPSAVRTWRPRVAAIAASVVAVLGVGTALLVWHGQPGYRGAGECIAYVNGSRVTSDSEVMNLVSSDLESLDDASASVDGSVEQQLGSLGAAMELDDN